MKWFRFLFLLSTLALGLQAQARIDVKKTKRLYLPVDVSEPLLTSESTQKILPKNVSNGESSSSVIQEMLDNTLSLWWEKSPAKNSAVGQVADKVDKKLKTEVNFGKSNDQKTEHKVTIKLLAMQALARVEYNGWVRAQLNYDARAAKTEAELLESLSENKDLVVSQIFSSNESKSQVSLRWNW